VLFGSVIIWLLAVDAKVTVHSSRSDYLTGNVFAEPV
jgi:hypothetical protein